MQIGEAAKLSGVSAKRIRHYEAIGLIAAARMDSNYRTYTPQDVQSLRFIDRARGLGFSMPQIESLLRMRSSRSRTCAEVRAIAITHIAELEAKIHDMQQMAAELRVFTDVCSNDDSWHCSILNGLDGKSA